MKKLIYIILIFMSPAVYAGYSSISIGSYNTRWQTTDFTVQGYRFRTDENEQATGIAYQYGFDFGLSVGGAFSTATRDFSGTSSTFSGTINEKHLLANANYTFNRRGRFRPYVEAGLGFTRLGIQTDSGTGPDSTMRGINRHVGVGANVSFAGGFGMSFGAKYIDFDVVGSDSAGRMESSLSSYFVGMNVTFGR